MCGPSIKRPINSCACHTSIKAQQQNEWVTDTDTNRATDTVSRGCNNSLKVLPLHVAARLIGFFPCFLTPFLPLPGRKLIRFVYVRFSFWLTLSQWVHNYSNIQIYIYVYIWKRACNPALATVLGLWINSSCRCSYYRCCCLFFLVTYFWNVSANKCAPPPSVHLPVHIFGVPPSKLGQTVPTLCIMTSVC